MLSENIEQYANRLRAEAETFVADGAITAAPDVADLIAGEAGVDAMATLMAECCKLYARLDMACRRPDLFAVYYDTGKVDENFASAQASSKLSTL